MNRITGYFPFWSDYLHQQRFTTDYLLSLLIADQILDPVQCQQFFAAASFPVSAMAVYPPKYLAETGLINQSNGKPLSLIFLMQWLAAKYHLEFLHIDIARVDKALAASIMPYAYAFQHQIVALSAELSADSVAKSERITQLKIASSTPFNQIWVDHLTKSYPQVKISIILALPEDIKRLIQSIYLVDHPQVADEQGNATHPHEGSVSKDNLADLLNITKSIKMSDPDMSRAEPVIKIVDTLLHLAIAQQASDIHIEPQEQMTQVRFRIDGILQTMIQLPKDIAYAVVSRLKVLGNMDVTEKRLPQDGRLSVRDHQAQAKTVCYEIRVSSLPTAFGEKIVLRLFNPDILVNSFTQLGFSPDQRNQWQQLLRNKSGLLLVTGPTGSGKTTTLYSSLNYLASPEINVCTIEDPIELVIPNFNQMQVNHGLGLTFAQGLRTILRQDPDVIMVGEIRDTETAKIALQAALTGHLVLATLHTHQAVSAIARLLDLGIPAYLMQATLKAVLAQRLIRKLCQYCAGKTCQQCSDTGFKGRVAVYELLQIDANIREFMHSDVNNNHIEAYLKAQGHKNLYDLGQALVEEGITTSHELERAI